MYLILARNWEVIDAKDPKRLKRIIIPAGRHETERIKSPLGLSSTWIVLKGKKIGAPAGFWRQWSSHRWKDYQVIIREVIFRRKIWCAEDKCRFCDKTAICKAELGMMSIPCCDREKCHRRAATLAEENDHIVQK